MITAHFFMLGFFDPVKGLAEFGGVEVGISNGLERGLG